GGELQFSNNDSNHYKFTGKERDSETGLDYFGARYYSNGLGRFISADWSAEPVPVPYAHFDDPQSLNQYTYVRNTPTTYDDADGHESPIVNDPQAIKDFGDRFSRNTETLVKILSHPAVQAYLEVFGLMLAGGGAEGAAEGAAGGVAGG